MVTSVTTPDNIDAPFDVVQNIKTTTVKAVKKSFEPTPTRVPRAPTALTPKQESAVISPNLVLADQERIQRSHASTIYEGTSSNECNSTEMGRSHSLFQASNKINSYTDTAGRHLRIFFYQ
jgi:hypothetical protein